MERPDSDTTVALDDIGLDIEAEPTKKAIAHLDVLGMGVHDTAAVQREFSVDVPQGTDFFVEANPRIGHTLGGVFRACSMGQPKYDSRFVQYIAERVRDLLQRYDRVHLTGHSYGGMTVCLVVAMLEPAERERVHAATFGSIYVPRDLPGVTHYMFRGDIALRCNGLKAPEGMQVMKRVGDVMWVDPYQLYSGMKRKNEWQIHNLYGDILAVTLSTKNVALFPEQRGGAGAASWVVNAALMAVTVAAAFWQTT